MYVYNMYNVYLSALIFNFNYYKSMGSWLHNGSRVEPAWSEFQLTIMAERQAAAREKTRERVRRHRKNQSQAEKEYRREVDRQRRAEARRKENDVRRSQRLLNMRQQAQQRRVEEDHEQRYYNILEDPSPFMIL